MASMALPATGPTSSPRCRIACLSPLGDASCIWPRSKQWVSPPPVGLPRRTAFGLQGCGPNLKRSGVRPYRCPSPAGRSSSEQRASSSQSPVVRHSQWRLRQRSWSPMDKHPWHAGIQRDVQVAGEGGPLGAGVWSKLTERPTGSRETPRASHALASGCRAACRWPTRDGGARRTRLRLRQSTSSGSHGCRAAALVRSRASRGLESHLALIPAEVQACVGSPTAASNVVRRGLPPDSRGNSSR